MEGTTSQLHVLQTHHNANCDAKTKKSLLPCRSEHLIGNEAKDENARNLEHVDASHGKWN
jgi:hypothetical protein